METCWFCDEEVEAGEPRDYMAVGWERPRKRGGANQIKRRERVGPVAHPRCTDGGIVRTPTVEAGIDLTARYRARVAERDGD